MRPLPPEHPTSLRRQVNRQRWEGWKQMYDDTLAATGAGALLIGGHSIGLPAIVTVGAMLIATGLLTYRIATRSRRG